MKLLKKILRRLRQGRYYALNELDRQLERYVDFDNGYYVELGANDGVKQSNSLYFEKYRRWHGLLVEPSPHNFVACRRNRSARNSIYCAACVSFDNPQEFVRLMYSDLMTTAVGQDTDLMDPAAHARLGAQFLPSHETVFEFGAVARRLDDLMTEARSPSLADFLSLDVEGMEIEVLKGLDHDRHRFRYMLIECRDLPKVTEYLFRHDYVFEASFSVHDHLFRNARR